MPAASPIVSARMPRASRSPDIRPVLRGGAVPPPVAAGSTIGAAMPKLSALKIAPSPVSPQSRAGPPRRGDPRPQYLRTPSHLRSGIGRARQGDRHGRRGARDSHRRRDHQRPRRRHDADEARRHLRHAPAARRAPCTPPASRRGRARRARSRPDPPWPRSRESVERPREELARAQKLITRLADDVIACQGVGPMLAEARALQDRLVARRVVLRHLLKSGLVAAAERESRCRVLVPP